MCYKDDNVQRGKILTWPAMVILFCSGDERTQERDIGPAQEH
jgi:hypothetical protein